ncbi:STAS domain-containing protein [Prauserella oleivorans]|uniref:Anti-sigma factor antagonist n=1 Tax=Prauserella oleivorans TaxID=1478153 RepID=A0ABW5W525_9PSEU
MRSTDTNELAAQSSAGTDSAVQEAHGMRIDAERRSDEVVLARVTGEVDLLSAPDLRKWVREEVATPTKLVLDLDGVDFLGSAGLSVLAELAEKSAHNHLNWAVVASNRVVLRPLEATGLANQMPVYSSVDEAIKGLTKDS